MSTADHQGDKGTMHEGPIRVALVNDYEVVAAGVRALLEPFRDRVQVTETALLSKGEEVEEPSDVTLFDTYGRTRLGLEELRRLVQNPLSGRVIVYSADEEESRVQAAIALGAAGYISKAANGPDLVAAIESVAAGETAMHLSGRRPVDSGWPGREWGLTARESEVLAMLTAGLRNREIAESLFVSVDTVKTHLRHIYRKLGTNTRSRTVAKALSDPSFSRRTSAA
jgi:two-component system, NarL family, response regulator LiaR